MRYIHTDGVRPTAEWLERARAVQNALTAIAARLDGASEEEARAIKRELRQEIDRHSDLWGAFKPELEERSTGKCWYCETREKRSHMAVDHFRPKNAVKECNQHPGYWWLAFAFENYRYVCTLCNSPLRNEVAGETLGKGTHFPLLDEARRVFRPDEDMQGEDPYLLDPTVAADPPLLWFFEDGSATPKYTEAQSQLFFSRANTSIGVYNLNDHRITDARSLVAFEIKRQVQRGDKYLDDAMAGDPAARDHFQEAYRVLLRLVRPDAEYSAAARAFVAGYRDKDWVMQALITA